MTTPRPEKRRLGERTWPEVAAAGRTVLLVPVGSCEQHGPHLPLDTDTRIAAAVTGSVADRRSDVVVAPAVAYGSSGEHAGFAGTLSIGAEALRLVLVELGRSAFPPDGSGPHRGLVFVNGHGGNVAAVAEAVGLLVAEGRPVAAWSPRIRGGDAHAGRTETSLLLAIAPDAVRPERTPGATDPLPALLPRLRTGGVVSVSPNGVLGDPAGASAEEGRRILDALVADLDAAVDRIPGIPGRS